MTVLKRFNAFPDEAAAVQWVQQTRWPDGIRYCPKCGSDQTHVLPQQQTHALLGFRMPRILRHQNQNRHEQQPATRTKMGHRHLFVYLQSQGSFLPRLGPNDWHNREIGLEYAPKIRAGFADALDEKLTGTVEADETFAGAKSGTSMPARNGGLAVEQAARGQWPALSCAGVRW